MSETLSEKMVRIETRMDALERMAVKQDDILDEIKDISIKQAEHVEQIKGLFSHFETVVERLVKIEDKPAKKWEYLIMCIIAGVVSTIIGLIITFT